jgi:hypothetical protein
MNKYVRMSVVAALGVFLGMPGAFAGVAVQGGEVSEDRPISMVWATTSTDSIGNFGARSIIVGFKLIATGTDTAQCDLYDAAVLSGAATSVVIDELMEVNGQGTALQMWPGGYQVTTDVSVDVRNGACAIYFY